MAVIKPSFAKLWLTLHQKQKVIIIMRKKSFILLLLFISNTSLFSQNPLTEDALLEKQIYETGLIHAPLPLNTSRSFEENALKKEVLSSQPLTETEGADGWTHSGAGKMSFSKEKTTSGKGSIRLSFPTYTGKRAAGSPSETAAQTEPKEPAPAESVPPSKTEKNSGAPTSVSPDGRRKKH